MSPDELRVEVDEGIVWPQVCFVRSARARPYADLARSCAASRRFPTFLSSRHAAAKVIQYPHATMACTPPAAQGWRGPLYGFDVLGPPISSCRRGVQQVSCWSCHRPGRPTLRRGGTNAVEVNRVGGRAPEMESPYAEQWQVRSNYELSNDQSRG